MIDGEGKGDRGGGRKEGKDDQHEGLWSRIQGK